MPISELSAIARWPNVPACYGWLSLDRRGVWRLQGEPVAHAGLVEFMNRRYAADEAGNWYVQNGPQRVFVTLEYTPLVLRLAPDGRLETHIGEPAGEVDAAYLDDEGNMLLHAAAGIGLLDDRDLPAFLALCRDEHGALVGEVQWEALAEGREPVTGVRWAGLAIRPIRRGEVAARFGFRPAPSP